MEEAEAAPDRCRLRPRMFVKLDDRRIVALRGQDRRRPLTTDGAESQDFFVELDRSREVGDLEAHPAETCVLRESESGWRVAVAVLGRGNGARHAAENVLSGDSHSSSNVSPTAIGRRAIALQWRKSFLTSAYAARRSPWRTGNSTGCWRRARSASKEYRPAPVIASVVALAASMSTNS